MKKRRKKARRSKGSRIPQFSLLQHPFSNAEPAAVRDTLRQIAAKKAEEFPVLLERIIVILKQKNALQVLATVCSYSSLMTISENGETGGNQWGEAKQSRAELLQALALSIPFEEWGSDPAFPEDIQSVFDALEGLSDAFHMRRLNAIKEESTSEERALLTIGERVRLHTQAVRNWGYFGDVLAISNELYAFFDPRFKAAFGFSASELIKVGHTLVRESEKRFNERFQKLRRVFASRRPSEIVRRYYKEFPELKGSPQEMIAAMRGASADQIMGCVFAHADLALVDLCLFAPVKIAEQSNIGADRVIAILQSLGVSPGAFSAGNPEHFFLSNPVWQAPVIVFGDSFFCALPQSLFSHIHHVMRVLAEKANLQEELATRRADYLEEKVAKLVACALPDAKVVHGVSWQLDGTRYETDHVLKIDRTLLIIEDKSAALTASGLRGAPDRVRRHLRDLILAPSEQSARLESLITKARNGDTKATKRLEPFGIDFSTVARIVRLSVTLDDFSVIASAEIELKEAGLIPPGTLLAPAMNIADFQCVVDILDSPTIFIDYLIERARIQKAVEIVADELDYLGFYLESGFNIASIEECGAKTILTGMSAAIDKYYSARDAGISIPKPQPKLGPYFKKLLAKIEQRQPKRWIEIGYQLLRTGSYAEQIQIERLLEQLRKNVRRRWRDPQHECSLIISPPKIRDTIIIFHLFPEQLEKSRREIVEQLVSEVLSDADRKRCIAISRCIDRWEDEYASICVAELPPHQV